MTAKEILIGALQYYTIEIFEINETTIKVAKGYEVEVEKNGVYKLMCDGQVIAPFNDVDELCRFILL
jgi:hypothetical protein